jgi:hypothetical protein
MERPHLEHTDFYLDFTNINCNKVTHMVTLKIVNGTNDYYRFVIERRPSSHKDTISRIFEMHYGEYHAHLLEPGQVVEVKRQFDVIRSSIFSRKQESALTERSPSFVVRKYKIQVSLFNMNRKGLRDRETILVNVHAKLNNCNRIADYIVSMTEKMPYELQKTTMI